MRSQTLASLATAFIAATLVSCASGPPKESGFLGKEDYALLKEETDPLGAKVMRYISPEFTPGKYQALLLEPVRFYPEPKPDKQVSMGALNDILDYFNRNLRQKVGAKVKLVDEPGPGVARFRGAITAVNAQAQGLEPYQYIPIALVVTAAKRSATGTPEDSRIFTEVEILDSVSGARLAVAVREGTGEQLKKEQTGGLQVTLESVRPVIDKWIDAFAITAANYIKPK
jgi:hypothetical protein